MSIGDRRVHVGIAQDSKLGSIHFILYVNDIWNLRLKGRPIMYADDAVLIYVAENETELQNMMQHDMNIIIDWMNLNLISLNIDKTHLMLFGRAKKLQYRGTR